MERLGGPISEGNQTLAWGIHGNQIRESWGERDKQRKIRERIYQKLGSAMTLSSLNKNCLTGLEIGRIGFF